MALTLKEQSELLEELYIKISLPASFTGDRLDVMRAAIKGTITHLCDNVTLDSVGQKKEKE